LLSTEPVSVCKREQFDEDDASCAAPILRRDVSAVDSSSERAEQLYAKLHVRLAVKGVQDAVG